MDIICPKGHVSTDPDYCSECGAKIVSAVSAASVPVTTTTATSDPADTTDVCPDCGTKRSNPTAMFCEVCRYNFKTHTSWNAAAAPVAPTVDPAPAAVSTPAAEPVPAPPPPPVSISDAAGPIYGWDIDIKVDASLYTEPDPAMPLPTNEPDRTFPLDLADNLIGRRSDKRDIHPEIHINDPGISHRHAKLLREMDGTYALLDLGSANGTCVNGGSILAGVKTVLKDGDSITLGMWTRITIRARRS